MEDVDKDNEQQRHRNVAPQKKIRIIELSDESSDSDDSATYLCILQADAIYRVHQRSLCPRL